MFVVLVHSVGISSSVGAIVGVIVASTEGDALGDSVILGAALGLITGGEGRGDDDTGAHDGRGVVGGPIGTGGT